MIGDTVGKASPKLVTSPSLDKAGSQKREEKPPGGQSGIGCLGQREEKGSFGWAPSRCQRDSQRKFSIFFPIITIIITISILK